VAHLSNTPEAHADDIDHLASRRVRFVGELFQMNIRKGMAQIKRNIQNRMSTIDTDVSLPVQFISPKPLQARIKEFFTTNQLAQLMQQENPLAEIEHLRTLSALGPGGLNRSRAGFEVRDVHHSHYGRLCPINTPEGPNIGLVLRLSVYARLNDFGMIETLFSSEAWKETPPDKRILFTIGKKGYETALRLGHHVEHHFAEITEKSDSLDALAVIEAMIELWEKGTVKDVFLVSTHYINPFTTLPNIKRYLPFSTKMMEDHLYWKDYAKKKQGSPSSQPLEKFMF
jgi:uncharacterized protein YfbU (UPF0304 family)